MPNLITIEIIYRFTCLDHGVFAELSGDATMQEKITALTDHRNHFHPELTSDEILPAS